jgi:hypothetical protein
MITLLFAELPTTTATKIISNRCAKRAQVLTTKKARIAPGFVINLLSQDYWERTAFV